MTSSKQRFEQADETRRAVRKWNGKFAEIMVAPGIESPDDVLADKTDNTLKASVFKDPTVELRITVPKWTGLPAVGVGKDELKVYHRIGSLTQEVFSGTYDQSNADELPLSVLLDKEHEDYGADGAHLFTFTLIPFNTGDPISSDPLTLIFDRLAPNRGEVPAEVPVVAEVVDGNVGAVNIVLPNYPDRAPKDHVYFYWLKDVPDDFTNVVPAGDAEVTSANQSLPVPKTVIEAVGDGECFAVYVLIDKAGNISQVSKPRSVAVALGAMPANLKDPLVPLADDGLIDREDATLGVQVLIPTFDNWKPSDQVIVKWEGHELSPREIGAGQDFPLVFSVARDVLRAQYGKPAEGTKSMAVRYDVWRGGRTRGNKQVSVAVNFETFGPIDPGPDPDPDWPDPVNSRLPLCDVFGGDPSKPNVLLPVDDGKPATLEVELYEGLAEDDLIEFFWGEEHVTEADYLVSASDKAGDTLSRSIPWRYIHETGNGTVGVHYEVTRTGIPNKPTSLERNVAVSAIVVHPDAPEFQGVNAAGWLACAALKDPNDPAADPAIRVAVGDLTQYGLADGDKVTLFWWVLHGQSGDEEVVDAALEQTITLGKDYPATGFTWRVEPYADHILPVYEFDQDEHTGRAYCRYEFEEVTQRRRGLHALIISDTVEQKIAMQDPFAGPCPVFFYRR